MLRELESKLVKPVNLGLVLLMAIYNFLTGLWLLMPFVSLSEKLEKAYAPEWSISLLLIAIGVIIAYGILNTKYAPLVFGLGLGSFVWLSAFFFLLINNVFGLGWIAALTVFAYCGFVFINVRLHSEVFDER